MSTKSSILEIQSNDKWNERKNSLVTLITPVFNRRDVLHRTLNSVRNQTYDNFEYIIVNDGSNENIDDIVCEFMNSVSFPVLYIKKENGGVHTARNIGTEYARGYYWMNLDSDDELLPIAMEVLVDKWSKIPIEERNQYFEVRACCINQNDERVGKLYPEQGQMSVEEWNRKCRTLKFDNVVMRRTQVMKNNLFPEPAGIRFVPESLLWKKLEKTYKSYYMNEVLEKVHLEPNGKLNDHLSKNRNNSVNIVEGACWKTSYMINNWDDYGYFYGVKGYLERILKFCMYAQVLKKYNMEWEKYNFNKPLPRGIRRVFWGPGKILSLVYIKTRM